MTGVAISAGMESNGYHSMVDTVENVLLNQFMYFLHILLIFTVNTLYCLLS